MKQTLIRQATVTETDERTFVGLAVTFNEVIEFDGQKEMVSPTAFNDLLPVKVYRQHLKDDARPVGRVEQYNITDKGLEIVVRLDETEQGEATYQDLKAGAVDGLSIQGVASASHMDGDVLVYDGIELFEISIVDRPAYPNARIEVVRAVDEENLEVSASNAVEDCNTNKEINEEMTEVNYDDSEIRAEIADIRRSLEVSNTKEEATELTIKSFGEYVKRYIENDAEVENIRRAYTGGTSADSVLANGWTADIIKIVDNGRPTWNLWSKGQWVAEGSNIEYAKLESNTVAVSSQTEGENLVFGKVSVTSAFTPKLTRGGYTEMTLQEIKRSNVNILDVAFRAMAAAYGQATNADAVSAVTGAAAKNLAGVTLATGTATSWVDYLVDAAIHLESKGLAPEFLVVSNDIYKELAGLTMADNFVLNRDSGSVDVTGLSGEVLNLPIARVAGTGFVRVANSSAIRTFEEPGAPFNLQDENILNLSKTFSIYGDVAVAVQDAEALVKPNAIS